MKGEAIFVRVIDEVKRMKGTSEIKKEEKYNPETNINTKKEVETKPKIEFSKIKEFKIVETIGAEGGLDYLSYQIQERKANGYSQKEIMVGVIRAIKGGSSLRRYLEGRPAITEENFMKILRAHFNVKDSTTLFNKMANVAQEPAETELNYVLRMMSLRDSIVTLSKKEGVLSRNIYICWFL